MNLCIAKYTHVFLGWVELQILCKVIFVTRVFLQISLQLLHQFFLCGVLDIIGISIEPCAGDSAAEGVLINAGPAGGAIWGAGAHSLRAVEMHHIMHPPALARRGQVPKEHSHTAYGPPRHTSVSYTRPLALFGSSSSHQAEPGSFLFRSFSS